MFYLPTNFLCTVPAKNITNEEASSTTREPLSGLHGMVDNVLEILPQDQLWALFFDEFESNKQFAAVVDSISSAKFPKILNGLQVSPGKSSSTSHVVYVIVFPLGTRFVCSRLLAASVCRLGVLWKIV